MAIHPRSIRGIQRLRMPHEQATADQRHRLHQAEADHRDLNQAGEHAARVGKARGRRHGAADAITAHDHLGHDVDDQRDRQRHLEAGQDLRQRGRQNDLPLEAPLAGAEIARRP
jgi:hypothetical protein